MGKQMRCTSCWGWGRRSHARSFPRLAPAIAAALALVWPGAGEAQLRDILEDALGRSKEIVSFEEVEGDAFQATFRVGYQEVEAPTEVQLTARPIDRSLRSLDGFSSEAVALTTSAGTTLVRVTFEGEGAITSAGFEIKLRRGGRSFAKKFFTKNRAWGAAGTALTEGDDEPAREDGLESAETGLSSDVVIPIPVGDTPSGAVSGGGSRSGGGGSTSPPTTTTTVGTVGGVVAEVPSLANYAYVWAEKASEPSYRPSATYAYNPRGGVQVRRIGAGRYQVTFERFSGSALHGQVTAYGSGPERCNAGGFLPASGGTSLMVYCFAPTGVPTDSRFTALVRSSAAGGSAFAYADRATQAEYRPAVAGGAAVDVRRSSTGIYQVTFDNFRHTAATHVQVTARESRAIDCSLQSWRTASASRLEASVQCFNAAGGRSDGRFEILVASRPAGFGRLGYVASEYDRLRSPSYLYNSTGQGGEVRRSGAGTYSVRLPGLGSGGGKGGTVQVTAVGGSNRLCKVVGWSYSGFTASVVCHDRSGAKSDANFAALVVR